MVTGPLVVVLTLCKVSQKVCCSTLAYGIFKINGEDDDDGGGSDDDDEASPPNPVNSQAVR